MGRSRIAQIEIDPEKCDGEGLCLRVCTAGVFVDGGDGALPVVAYPAECFFCGHCVAVCPTAAIMHHGMDVGNFPEIRANLTVDAQRLLRFMRSRRSVRIYNQGRSVPRAAMGKLIEAARYAPTGSNAQSLEHIVISDRPLIARLSRLCVDELRKRAESYRDDLAMGELDPTRASRLREQLSSLALVLSDSDAGKDPIFYSAPVVVIIHADPAMTSCPREDAAIAAHHMIQVAQSLGLGTCYIGYFFRRVNRNRAIREILEIPQGHDILMTFTVGYPAIRYRRLVDRLKPHVRWIGYD
jgi:nitroreductase/NAD-dependent dihydropyrimidine dehydrogenase PreA subunit